MLPEDVAVATKEQLVDRFVELDHRIDDLEAERSVLREEILSRLNGDGEVIGNFTVTRVVRTNYNFSKISLDQARELGAVKEVVDTNTLKKLYLKKVKLPEEPTVSVVSYPLIKDLPVKE